MTELEQYRNSLERLLAAIEERLADAKDAPRPAPAQETENGREPPDYNGEPSPSPPPGDFNETLPSPTPPPPFRDFVTFPADEKPTTLNASTTTTMPPKTTAAALNETLDAAEDLDWADSVFDPTNETTTLGPTSPSPTATSASTEDPGPAVFKVDLSHRRKVEFALFAIPLI